MNERINFNEIKRGDVFFADLPNVGGSVQVGLRPVTIIQNDMGNKFSPNIIIVPLTSELKKTNLKTHFVIKARNSCLKEDSMTLCENIMSIPKTRLVSYLGRLNDFTMSKIDMCLQVSIALDKPVEEMDFNYIEEKVAQISKLERVQKIANSNELTDVILEMKRELKKYCLKYGRLDIFIEKYKEYISDRGDKKVI